MLILNYLFVVLISLILSVIYVMFDLHNHDIQNLKQEEQGMLAVFFDIGFFVGLVMLDLRL